MVIRIKKTQLLESSDAFMKSLGYGIIHDYNKDAFSYVKRLTSIHYPRFHAYVEEGEEFVEVHLHLDQKAPVYEGQKAHQGEYSGPLVKAEAQRIFAKAHQALVSGKKKA